MNKARLNPIFRVIGFIGLGLVLVGCQTTGSVEYGVVFNRLPPLLGGGVSEKVVPPGQTTWLMPWQQMIVLDTGVKSLVWGEPSTQKDVAYGKNDWVSEKNIQTRTQDGNEVGLVMVVQYKLDPTKLPHIIQNVGISNERIRQIVSAVAVADIRSFMNTLNTGDFMSKSTAKRNEIVAKVAESLNYRLGPEGIIIEQVVYKNHQFERDLPGGKVDRSFQDQVERTQATYQEAQQEEKKIKTVEEQKKREYNEAEAAINRLMEEAKGLERQARLRGDAYYTVKQNVAGQIETKGEAEVDALKKQIDALSGAGGKSLLRLEIVKALARSQSKFVLLDLPDATGSALTVNKVDTNDLMRQLGLVTALSAGDTTRPADKELVSPAIQTPSGSSVSGGPGKAGAVSPVKPDKN